MKSVDFMGINALNA